MKAYGVDRRDRGCCPVHDKFPRDHFNSNRSRRAHAKSTRLAHKRARARQRDAWRRTRGFFAEWR